MSTSTLPYTASAAAPLQDRGSSRREHVGFWRAPFAAVTYREIGHVLVSLPVAIAGFGFAVSAIALGAGLLVTVLGLPVLAAALAAARGLGAAERRRARTGLGLDVAGPAPLDVPRDKGRWAGVRARLADGAGWRALLFQLVMFPWRVLSFTLSVTFLVTGWVVALFPTYSWVFHHYVGWPGYRLYDFTSGGERHHYYITSPAQVLAVGLVGAVLVFLTPKLIRALTGVDRAAVRSLLG
ncbi:sensor domain-containing protein [Streptomyces formicae]|uniref:Putative two-component system sensor kinase n=1 Tax=Streptomyces formicae TaxID=1616117 RepID=A0A291QBR1_9ACTN|nr:sensor domain-containing protein [Streptomyces formicae]ATL28927.1 putative two-component system sensor kinase [Streptomyces formicae]